MVVSASYILCLLCALQPIVQSYYVTFRLVTWNAADKKPPSDVNTLLGVSQGATLPTVIAVGLQEATGSIIEDAFGDDGHDSWTDKFNVVMSSNGYVQLESIRLNGINLSVYVLRSEVTYISYLEKQSTGTGIAGFWANKGGASIRFKIHGWNIIFVNSHLAAHLDKIDDRVDDVKAIIDTQQFTSSEMGILDHDYIFWMGDLNFRLDDVPIETVKSTVQEGNIKDLWQYDQLTKLMSSDTIFEGFEEGQLSFAPTYKYDKGTSTFDTSKKQRKPAWTDRILWKVKGDSSMAQLSYDSIPSYTQSDHKPVYSEFYINFASQQDAPISFAPISSVSCDEDLTVTYTALPGVSVSSSDWIGLYPSYSYQYYHTWVWAAAQPTATNEDGRSEFSVVLSSSRLKKCKTEGCALLYHSKAESSHMAFSNAFTVTC